MCLNVDAYLIQVQILGRFIILSYIYFYFLLYLFGIPFRIDDPFYWNIMDVFFYSFE